MGEGERRRGESEEPGGRAMQGEGEGRGSKTGSIVQSVSNMAVQSVSLAHIHAGLVPSVFAHPHPFTATEETLFISRICFCRDLSFCDTFFLVICRKFGLRHVRVFVCYVRVLSTWVSSRRTSGHAFCCLATASSTDCLPSFPEFSVSQERPHCRHHLTRHHHIAAIVQSSPYYLHPYP